MAFSIGHLFGRDEELVWLVDRIAATRAGNGAAVLIEGEPGIGKTALVQFVSSPAIAHDCQVFHGAGDELASDLPLMPLLDALDVDDASEDPERAAITRLLHGDLHTSATELVAAAGERIIGLVDEECVRGPAILVLDDLHWADRATVAIWHRLAKLAAHLPLLLIGTTRPPSQGDDVLVLQDDRSAVDTLRLGPLSGAAVAELVGELTGGRPSADLSTMAEGAAGNPLYVTELISTLHRDGGLAVRPSGVVEVQAAQVPGSLSAAIEHRLGFLSGDAHLVLRAAALLGMRFTATNLATALHRRMADLIPVLDQATVAGVLIETGTRLSFRHPLVRAALYEGMPMTVRAAWHAEIGHALVERGAPMDDVARQLIAAFDPQAGFDRRPDRWVLDWLSANGASLVSKAPDAAARLLDRVVEPAEADPDPLLVCRLADALYRAGRLDRAEEVCRTAMGPVADTGCLTELHWTLFQCRAMTGRAAESVPELEAALAEPACDAASRARLRALLARTHWNLGDRNAADEMARTALTEARDTGDSLAAGWALHVRTIVAMEHRQMREALPLFDQAKDVLRPGPTTTDLRLLLQINRAVTLASLDEVTEAVDAAREARELADRSGHVVRMAQAQSALGQLLYDRGDWDDALVEVDLLADDLKHPMVVCCDHGVAALINLQRGDPDTAHQHLATARTSERQLGARMVPLLALADSMEHERGGNLPDALAVLLAAAGDGLEAEELLADIVRLAVLAGAAGTARNALARLETLATDSEVPHRIASVSLATGLIDADADRLLRAAGEYEDAGQPLFRAKAYESAAVALADDGDTAAAREALGHAVELYTELGADWHVARAVARLRGHGVRRGPQGTHQRASSGWASLTPAETVVAELVREGMSNRQIAEQLFLSPRTVATHVSHILGKLRVRTRTDIAREASVRALASR
ncbi:MAG TPA: AAA family ATPase [Pseudonocardiaceae bacterium]|nr:AAA family ATPase [Pseudonocardiaceae bacterium]